MGWSIGFDENWGRDVGYGVPAFCDHPECSAEIDRGLSYVCGREPFGGTHGCGLYFCHEHQRGVHQWCERCAKNEKPFDKKPDHPRWVQWQLTDDSWAQWRADNPELVARMRASLEAL